MNTQVDPRELAFIIAKRANDFQTTPYQMGAVLADDFGVFSWGWCHRGNRNYLRSVHAERHAIERANRTRLIGATLYVAGLRKNSGRKILSMPCSACLFLSVNKRISTIEYYNPDLSDWLTLKTPITWR